MAADLTFKIDAEASGLEGEVNSAMAKLQKFGETGGLVGRATSLAMGTVTGAVKTAEGAMSSFISTGKGAVAMLNHINGAVELANKVIPALTFPLSMAGNAEKTKAAFDDMTASWGEVAGALGEGVNDALTPILKSAGFELGKLKEKAREIGQGIGDAIDIARVSYQMGKLPDILWVGLQKVTLQWGASLIEFFTTFGFKLTRIFDDAMSGAIARVLDAVGADEKAAKVRSSSDSRQASSVTMEADALAATKEFLSPVYDQIGALGDQMAELTAPVKERISQEREAAKSAEAASEAFKSMATGLTDGINSLFGNAGGKGGKGGGGGGSSGGGGKPSMWDQIRTNIETKQIADMGLGTPQIYKSKADPLTWQGPLQEGQKAPSIEEMRKDADKSKLPPPAPDAKPDRRKRYGTHHIKGAGFGKKDVREGLGYFNGKPMAGPATPNLDAGISTPRLDAAAAFRGTVTGAGHKLDPAALVHGVTNKTGARAAAKQERAAEQKDAVSAKAAEAVATSLPQMQKDLAMLAKKLNVELK